MENFIFCNAKLFVHFNHCAFAHGRKVFRRRGGAELKMPEKFGFIKICS